MITSRSFCNGIISSGISGIGLLPLLGMSVVVSEFLGVDSSIVGSVKKQQVETCEDVCSYLDPFQQFNEHNRRTYSTKSDTTYRKFPRTQEQVSITLEPTKQFANYYTPIPNNGSRPMPLIPDDIIPLQKERDVITTQKQSSERELTVIDTAWQLATSCTLL